MLRSTALRISLFLATVVAIWGVLSLGSSPAELDLDPGEPAPMTFRAVQSVNVVDVERTEELRQAAKDAVVPERFVSPEVQQQVEDNITAVFTDAEDLVVLNVNEPAFPIPVLPEVTEGETGETEGETGEGEEPAPVEEPEPIVLTGQVFLDVNGNGVFDPEVEATRVDQGLAGIRIAIQTHVGDQVTTTDAQGEWSIELPTGPAVMAIDASNGSIPAGWIRGSGDPAQLILCDPGETCAAEGVGFVVSLRPLTEVLADLAELHPSLPAETIEYLAATASDDVVRKALGEPVHLPTVFRSSLDRMSAEFGRFIELSHLAEVQAGVRAVPPQVFHNDTGRDVPGGDAAAEIVASHLMANWLINEPATQAAQEAAALAVPPQTRQIRNQQIIVSEGELLTQFDIDAINAAASRPGFGEQAWQGLLAVIVALVGVLGLYLARFRREIWSRPRMVALLGILMLLAAASVRATVAVADSASWYVLPAVAFGFITAILFDQRIALLMALAVGVLTAVGTQDLGITVYAVLAAMAPIPFVSSVSSRGAFRNAIVLSSLTAAGVAAATSSFFHVGPTDVPLEVIGMAVAWAFGASVVASLVGLAALQFFESTFDITTTLSLLDLTDRNHEALQLLQEKAFGTFNHSLMVGTLADAASRSIGANPLLARAMAYYHDLGKTENPTFFIENQFGIQNPHDFIDPKESAEILRSHITDGVALARQFKIPTDVAQGIVSHHGDGVMRFFYEKARAKDGDEVNVDDFRHIGHKPRTAETAILMLADSLEAACRAIFQVEEPTPDAIEKVVNRIIDEKVEDGQLSESPLTLAELTQIRKAFLDSLVGHYHQRIAYPNFPGS